MKTVLLFLFFLCFSSLGSSQTLNGKVIDQNNNPISGAYVVHLQSDHHAHSNEDGFFILNDIQLGDSLQVMHIGYKTAILELKEPLKDFIIQLEENVFLF